jgi:hypothetical protein
MMSLTPDGSLDQNLGGGSDPCLFMIPFGRSREELFAYSSNVAIVPFLHIYPRYNKRIPEDMSFTHDEFNSQWIAGSKPRCPHDPFQPIP